MFKFKLPRSKARPEGEIQSSDLVMMLSEACDSFQSSIENEGKQIADFVMALQMVLEHNSSEKAILQLRTALDAVMLGYILKNLQIFDEEVVVEYSLRELVYKNKICDVFARLNPKKYVQGSIFNLNRAELLDVLTNFEEQQAECETVPTFLLDPRFGYKVNKEVQRLLPDLQAQHSFNPVALERIPIFLALFRGFTDLFSDFVGLLIQANRQPAKYYVPDYAELHFLQALQVEDMDYLKELQMLVEANQKSHFTPYTEHQLNSILAAALLCNPQNMRVFFATIAGFVDDGQFHRTHSANFADQRLVDLQEAAQMMEYNSSCRNLHKYCEFCGGALGYVLHRGADCLGDVLWAVRNDNNAFLRVLAFCFHDGAFDSLSYHMAYGTAISDLDCICRLAEENRLTELFDKAGFERAWPAVFENTPLIDWLRGFASKIQVARDCFDNTRLLTELKLLSSLRSILGQERAAQFADDMLDQFSDFEVSEIRELSYDPNKEPFTDFAQELVSFMTEEQLSEVFDGVFDCSSHAALCTAAATDCESQSKFLYVLVAKRYVIKQFAPPTSICLNSIAITALAETIWPEREDNQRRTRSLFQRNSDVDESSVSELLKIVSTAFTYRESVSEAELADMFAAFILAVALNISSDKDAPTVFTETAKLLYGRAATSVYAQAVALEAESLQLFEEFEGNEDIARNIFRRFLRMGEFASFYRSIIENESIMRKYYQRTSEIVSSGQEQLLSLFSQYDDNKAEKTPHYAFAPDFRFVAECGPVREQILTALTPLDGLTVTTFSPSALRATQLFYSLFGGNMRGEIKLLEACREALQNEYLPDHDISVYVGLNISTEALMVCADDILLALECSGVSKNAVIGLTDVQLDALLARFMLANVNFAQFFLLTVAGFYSSRAEVFEAASKVLDASDIKRNPNAASCIALLLSGHNFTMINAHKYVAKALYLTETALLGILDAGDYGEKAFLLFLIEEIRSLEMSYSEDALELIVEMVGCLIKQGQRGDRNWVRQVSSMPKGGETLRDVLVPLSTIENDDNYIFEAIFALLNGGCLEELFEQDFAQLRFNEQALLYVYERQQCVVSILSDFQLLYDRFINGEASELKVLENCGKARCQSAIFNTYRILHIMTAQVQNSTPIFEVKQLKQDFEDFFAALGDLVWKEQLGIHSYSEDEEEQNFFCEVLTSSELELFENLESSITALCDKTNLDETPIVELCDELVDGDWEGVGSMITNSCSEEYKLELLQASEKLENGTSGDFIKALLNDGQLCQLFAFLSDSFYNYVEVLESSSARLKSMALERLITAAEQLVIVDEVEEAVDGAQKIKELTRSISKIVSKEPDQDELCSFLVEQVESISGLEVGSTPSEIEDILGEVLSRIIEYKLQNIANVPKIIASSMQKAVPPEILAIYQDVKNEESVFPKVSEQGLASLFLRRIVLERHQADLMELLLDNLSEIKRYYKGASVFESDLFWNFVTTLREKEALLPESADFCDMRLLEVDEMEAMPIGEMIATDNRIFPKNYHKNGMLMATIFGFSAEGAVEYVRATVDHANSIVSGKERPVSWLSRVSNGRVDVAMISAELENTVEVLSAFLASTTQKVCFGDDALVLLLYNHLIENPSMLYFMLLTHSGILGNNDDIVKRLNSCSHGLCSNPKLCWYLAHQLRDLNEKSSLYLTAMVLVGTATKHVSESLEDPEQMKNLLYHCYMNCSVCPSEFSVMLFVELISLMFAVYNPDYLRFDFIHCLEGPLAQELTNSISSIEQQSASVSEFNFELVLLLIQRKQLDLLFSTLDTSCFDEKCPLHRNGIRWLLYETSSDMHQLYEKLDDNAQTVLQHQEFIGQHRQVYSFIGAWEMLTSVEKRKTDTDSIFINAANDLLAENKTEFAREAQQITEDWETSFATSPILQLDADTVLAEIGEAAEEARVSLSFESKHCTRLCTLLDEVFSNGIENPPFGPLFELIIQGDPNYVLLKQSIDFKGFFALTIKDNRLKDVAQLLLRNKEAFSDYYWCGSLLSSSEIIGRLADLINVEFTCGEVAREVEPEESGNKSANASYVVDKAEGDDLLEYSTSEEETEQLGAGELLAESFSQHSIVQQPLKIEFSALPTENVFSGTAVDHRCTSFEGFFLQHDTLYEGVATDYFDLSQQKIQTKSISINLDSLKYTSSSEELKMFNNLEIPRQEIFGEVQTTKDACDECGAPISFLKEFSQDPKERAFELNQQNGIYCAYSNKCFCPHCAGSAGYFQAALPRSDGNLLQISGKRLCELWRVFYLPLYDETQIDISFPVMRKLRFLRMRLPLIAACDDLKAAIEPLIDIDVLADPNYSLYYKSKLSLRAYDELKAFSDKTEKSAQVVLKKVAKSPFGEALAQRIDAHAGDFEELLNVVIKMLYCHLCDCQKCIANFSECHECNQRIIGFKFNFEMYARFVSGVKTTNAACAECARILHKACANESGLCSECQTYLKQYE